MPRRVAFTTLSPQDRAHLPPNFGTTLTDGEQRYIAKVKELERRYGEEGGADEELAWPIQQHAQPTPKRKKQKKRVKKKNKKKPKKKLRKTLNVKKIRKKRPIKRQAIMGVALTRKTTLRSIVHRLPWGKVPLSELLGIEGWLNKKATLCSLINKLPQSKTTVLEICGIKGCS